MASQICVFGSICMDVVIQAPSFPGPGETLFGGAFCTYPGGKGANRAVAASRLGADVTLVGCVGDDAWGSELRAVLASEGVGAAGIVTRKGRPTGACVITVPREQC